MVGHSLIAIDGPAASGKSTVGRLVAQRLGYRFIDTGMMYRAVTWLALHYGIDPDNETALSRLAIEACIEVIPPPTVAAPFRVRSRVCSRVCSTILVNHRDITDKLYLAPVESRVSLVSKVAGVRHAMVAQQQHLAEGGKIVMAGRDIGTVVLPQAELKVFLRASAEERARRRYQEHTGKEHALSLSQILIFPKYKAILADLKQRDEIDSHRSHSPLHPDRDAHIIDTEGLTVEQVVSLILNW